MVPVFRQSFRVEDSTSPRRKGLILQNWWGRAHPRLPDLLCESDRGTRSTSTFSVIPDKRHDHPPVRATRSLVVEELVLKLVDGVLSK